MPVVALRAPLPLSHDQLDRMNAYWRAANYLSVGSKQLMRDKRLEHKTYIAERGEDMPEIRDWRWPY
jgi:xylulose-5-phosphate/fructose-6-phosphate phosphoketolase